MTFTLKEVIGIIIILVLIGFSFKQYYDCDKLGGVLVGGRCIEAKFLK